MTHDRPDARELIEAVTTWLTTEIAPTLDDGPRFQAMVAAHGLTIALRELTTAEEHEALDRVAFGPLAPEIRGDAAQLRRALAEAIAAGKHDDGLHQVATVLREHVRRKLVIARPGYDL